MKYFVCSDIHSYYDEWMNALNEAKFDINNNDHIVIVCGDAFDRGSQSVEVFNFLKLLQEKNKLIYIRGNHEDLLFDCVEDLKIHNGCARLHHYSNGTVRTIKDFNSANILSVVLDFIDKYTINYFEIDKYIFVHGWIPLDMAGFYFDDWRNASKELWNKSRWVNPVELYNRNIFEPNKTIVCGHWHCSAFWHNYNPDKYDEFGGKANFNTFVSEKVISIDACTAISSKVNVYVIDE